LEGYSDRHYKIVTSSLNANPPFLGPPQRLGLLTTSEIQRQAETCNPATMAYVSPLGRDWSNTVNWDALGKFYAAFCVAWTVILSVGMTWLIWNRRLPFLRMRNIPLAVSSVVILHVYLVKILLVRLHESIRRRISNSIAGVYYERSFLLFGRILDNEHISAWGYCSVSSEHGATSEPQ
jgi:hypothetical protein